MGIGNQLGGGGAKEETNGRHSNFDFDFVFVLRPAGRPSELRGEIEAVVSQHR